ncbi:hypothetical protein QT972_20145, partial [Microcoleus sp. herbarium7]|uniref:hypothetical protein n=1 Tax=Microcoleus sp. herbarium7 TaxID=3055435 RepID=UPI002FD15F6F
GLPFDSSTTRFLSEVEGLGAASLRNRNEPSVSLRPTFFVDLLGGATLGPFPTEEARKHALGRMP